jgi:hypothetical protein
MSLSPGERDIQVLESLKPDGGEFIYPSISRKLREAAGIEEDDLMEILAYLTKEKVL